MKTFGLVGYPLKHSFSYRFFGEKFEKEKIDAQYLNFEIADIGRLPDIIKEYTKLQGLNVTIPYKEQVIPFLDELDPIAEAIGAVNVIKITRKGDKILLKGFNSDYIGFKNSIEPLINPEIHRKALILGTGGASKAVEYGLKALGLETSHVSRTRKEGVITYGELSEDMMNEYTVIVNASPVGTFPNVDECPDIPYQYIGNKHMLYDVVYNPPVTKFLEQGKKQGAKIKNGETMLELQAIAAWNIWNDL